ncbi:hypothetical protein KP509_35G020800 [Ceratopteris richardii]|nr:hypothetical protein KP509_35G020800 [Ceratopteris richardii]
MMKEHHHKDWNGGRKGCHGKKGGWKKGYGKDGHGKGKDKDGHGHGHEGYEKQYPGNPH